VKKALDQAFYIKSASQASPKYARGRLDLKAEFNRESEFVRRRYIVAKMFERDWPPATLASI